MKDNVNSFCNNWGVHFQIRHKSLIITHVSILTIKDKINEITLTVYSYHRMTGAYNSTKESQRRSLAAQSRVDDTENTVRESEYVRNQVEDLIADNQDDFDRQYQDNEQSVRDIDTQLDRLDDKITDLNGMVCMLLT